MKFNKKNKDQERTVSDQVVRAERYRYHSSMRSDDQEVRRRTEEPKSASRAGRFTILMSIGVIAASFFYVLWLDSVPRLRMQNDANDISLLQDEGTYEAGIKDILDNSLSNRSKLLINTSAVADHIESSYPEVAEAVITLPLLDHKPIVDLVPKQPKFIMNTKDGPYIIDETGTALLHVRDLENSDDYKLPTVTDQSGIGVSPGMRVVNRDVVAFIDSVLYQFESKGMLVSDLVLPPLPNELHLNPQGKSYYIKFDLSGEAREQAGSYFAVSELLAEQGKEPAEYIDVRVSGKAFYK